MEPGFELVDDFVIYPNFEDSQDFQIHNELAVARAARVKRHLQILSTVTTSSIEEVTSARGAPVWYQIYPTSDRRIADRLLARAEAAGCPVVVFTVDLLAGSNRETVARYERRDDRQCSVCHESGFSSYVRRKPMFDGIDVSSVAGLNAPGLTWDFVRWLKSRTKMKLVVKGIVTHEDARLCLDAGADGILVSNHGGRAEASGRATVACLPEVVGAVGGRIPVLVDGGFRRGTDVFKALALGARASCRPFVRLGCSKKSRLEAGAPRHSAMRRSTTSAD